MDAYKGERSAGNLCRIVRTKHDVWTSEHLKQSGYPDTPSHPAYFMIRIRKPNDTERELKKQIFNVKDVPVIYWGNKKMSFILVKMKDLQCLADTV